MRATRFLFAVLTIVLFAHEAVLACSICRCGDQSFFLNNARQLSSGRFLFAVEHFNMRKSSTIIYNPHEGDHGLAKLFSPSRVQHDIAVPESQVQNAVQLNFKYGLSNRVMLMAAAPYTFNRLSSAAGAETVNGLGDPEIMAIARLFDFSHRAWSVHASAGTRIPLGASDQKDEAGARLEQHLQTGAGAWAGIFGLQLMHGTGSVPLFFSVSYQTNATNDHDFAYGNVFRFNTAAQRALFGSFDLIAEVNGRVADYDKEGAENDLHSGGTVVYASPGLRWRFGSVLSLRSQVQIPVVENLHGEQNEKVNVRTGLVWEL